MKLSKQTSDAIAILSSCVEARDDDTGLRKVGEIAAELDLPKQMALKLAYILNKAGFVEAVRGPKGGIRLTERAKNASIGEIVRSIEWQPNTTGARKKDTLGGYLDDAFEAFLVVLDQHKLVELASKKRSKRKPATKKAKPKRRAPAKQNAASAQSRA